MQEFLDTAVSFPAAVFGILLVIVVAYWLVVLLGVVGDDLFDGDAGDGDIGLAGLLGAVGLGGVPVAAVLSLWIAFGWFSSFVGAGRIDEMSGTVRVAAGAGVIALAVAVGYAATFLVVIPLRPVFPESAPPPGRRDLVGRT